MRLIRRREKRARILTDDWFGSYTRMDSILPDEVPNPFERRRFAFRVLPEEKDPMSRARHYSRIMPTLKSRLQQLITTRLWERMMLVLSIWSMVSLLIGHRLPGMQLFFELTHAITQGPFSHSHR